MGRGKHLSEEEKTIAQRMKQKGYSVREVMIVLQRSETAERNAVRSVPTIQKQETRGGSPKLTKKMESRIIRKGSKGDRHASDIRAEVEAPLSVRKIQQIFHDS